MWPFKAVPKRQRVYKELAPDSHALVQDGEGVPDSQPDAEPDGVPDVDEEELPDVGDSFPSAQSFHFEEDSSLGSRVWMSDRQAQRMPLTPLSEKIAEEEAEREREREAREAEREREREAREAEREREAREAERERGDKGDRDRDREAREAERERGDKEDRDRDREPEKDGEVVSRGLVPQSMSVEREIFGNLPLCVSREPNTSQGVIDESCPCRLPEDGLKYWIKAGSVALLGDGLCGTTSQPCCRSRHYKPVKVRITMKNNISVDVHMNNACVARLLKTDASEFFGVGAPERQKQFTSVKERVFSNLANARNVMMLSFVKEGQIHICGVKFQ